MIGSQPLANLVDQKLTSLVRSIYQNILAREPDKSGLIYWTKHLRAGGSLDELVSVFLASSEFERIQEEQVVIDKILASVDVAMQNIDLSKTGTFIIVDIGAQDLENEEHVYEPLLKSNIPYEIIGFEPLERRRLERAQNTKYKVKLLPDIIADGKVRIFNVNSPDSTSSVLPFNCSIISKFHGLAGLKTVKSEPVQTSTLDLALNGISNVDFIKLDIQGGELLALQGATNVLKKALAVHCEVEFAEIYRGQGLFSEIELFMRSLGFYLVDIISTCKYPLAEAGMKFSRDILGWGEAIFFREIGENPEWRDALFQSLIAMLVYDKMSLASDLAKRISQDSPAEPYRSVFIKKTHP